MTVPSTRSWVRGCVLALLVICAIAVPLSRVKTFSAAVGGLAAAALLRPARDPSGAASVAREPWRPAVGAGPLPAGMGVRLSPFAPIERLPRPYVARRPLWPWAIVALTSAPVLALVKDGLIEECGEYVDTDTYTLVLSCQTTLDVSGGLVLASAALLAALANAAYPPRA